MYYFSTLALTLNEQEEGVAPTDSRRRPDQRLMEQGRWEEANAEKQRLEEKQRTARREREREANRATNPSEEGKEPADGGKVSFYLSFCSSLLVSSAFSASLVYSRLSVSLSFPQALIEDSISDSPLKSKYSCSTSSFSTLFNCHLLRFSHLTHTNTHADTVIVLICMTLKE